MRVGDGWFRAWNGGESRRGVKDGILESLFFYFPVYPFSSVRGWTNDKWDVREVEDV